MLSEDLDRLERQVAEDKKELNILIAQIRDGQYYGNPVDDPVMKNRIRNIQDNLYYLEAQLDIARREFEKPKPAAQNIYAIHSSHNRSRFSSRFNSRFSSHSLLSRRDLS